VVRLTAARASAVILRFARPMRTAHGVFSERSSAILQLMDADGVVGYGEAAPWPGFGTESVEEALAALTGAEPQLIGADLDPGQWPDALEKYFSRTPAARAAVEGALWDLAARRAGRPLAEYLSTRLGPLCGPLLDRVPVGALLVQEATDTLRAEAGRARAAGHRAAKLKVGGRTLAEDLVRVQAARDGLGPDVALRCDANGSWSEHEAREALAALAQFDLDYVEQPLPADAIDALARLRRDAQVRIAADESVATLDGANRLLAAGAADVMVLKPASLGGPVRALEVAARARQAGCAVVFTHAFESAVGARHALHCAAAWGDPVGVHGLATDGLFLEDVAPPPSAVAGAISLSREPGIGIHP
jgi:o-succinylbenzoate synthase